VNDGIQPGWVVPGKSILVKVGPLGPAVEIPALRCACGGDALPLDSSYDAQRDTIEYICPECGSHTLEQVH
jgi:hypothetical protein